MTRSLLACVFLLVCIALCAGQGRRPRRLRNLRTGFASSDDCQQSFNDTQGFCAAYVDQCGDIIRNPQFPQAVSCGGCIFTWMTQCGQPAGRG